MNARVQPLVAFLMAVVAVPLLAQQGNPPTGEPATPDQTVQAAVAASPASELAAPLQVEGTIVSLTADRLELKVEKAVAPSSQSASGLEGQTVPFVVDATAEKPAQLKAGDRVDLWFTQDGGQRRAVRVVLAAAATKPKPTALAPAVPQPAGSTVLPNAGTGVMKTPPSVGATEPSVASPEPQGSVDVVDSVGAPPAGGQSQPAVRPESTAPLPFVALGGLAALAALLMLRFTLRGGHVELGIGTGKGGLR